MRLRRYVLHTFIAVLMASGIGSASAQTGGASCDPALDADTYLQRGAEAFQNEQIEMAIAETLCARAAAPDNAVVYNNLAYFQVRLGNFDEAFANYTESLRLDPDSVNTRVNRGDLLLDQGDSQAAIVDYDRAIALQATAYIHNRRGIAHFNLDDFAAAEADFSAAITFDADDANFVRNRAVARFQQGRYDESAADFTTAVQLAPNWDVPAYGVADAYFEGARYAEAGTAYRAAVTEFGPRDMVNARLRAIAVAFSTAFAGRERALSPDAIAPATAPRLALLDQILVGRYDASVTALAISPNGDRIISGDDSGVVVISDTITGGSVRRETFPAPILSAAIAPNRAAVVLADGAVILLDENIMIPLIIDEGSAANAAFTPDGSLLAAALTDGSVQFWDVLGRRAIGRFALVDTTNTANRQSPSPLTFSADGATFASVTGDSLVRVWNTVSAEILSTFDLERPVNALAFNPAGTQLAVGGGSGLTLFALASGEPIASVAVTGSILDLRFTPDGALLLAISDQGDLALFDAESLDELTQIDGGSTPYTVAVFTPDGTRLIAGGRVEGTQSNPVHVLGTLNTAVTLQTAGLAPIAGDNGNTLSLLTEVPPDGVIAQVRVTDANGQTGSAVVRYFADGRPSVILEALGSDRATLASASDGIVALAPIVRGTDLSETPAVILINADGTESARIEDPHPFVMLNGSSGLGTVDRMRFSPDGSLLVTSAYALMRVWRVDDGGIWRAAAELMTDSQLFDVQFSRSGSLLILQLSDAVVVYTVTPTADGVTLTEVARIAVEPDTLAGAVAIHPDETLIAIVTKTNTVQLWGVGA